MSYQVLARKWRPGKFAELVGQEHVVNAISNALDNNRLHHAYLFTGTRGVGKTTIARIFARSLNCDKGMSSNPCGVCSSCKDIEQGNFVDLLEIDAASRTKVEDTRELLDNVQYRPTRGVFKVYLIDEVHMLSKHSFNALLKTLEEPPPHVKFLLATTDPQKLPITILSRCLQFNLKALTRDQITGQLAHILKQENLPYDEAALALLAKSAQGSMRDALSLTDQAIAQGDGKVLSQVVADMLGLIDNDKIARLTHSIIIKDKAHVFQLIEALALTGADFKSALSELMSVFHQIALTQFVPEACKIETSQARQVFNWAKTIPPEQIQLLYQIALQGRRDIEWAQEPRMGFEMTVLRMLAFMPDNIAGNLEQFKQTSSEAAQQYMQHNAAKKIAATPAAEEHRSEPEIEPPETLIKQSPAEKKTPEFKPDNVPEAPAQLETNTVPDENSRPDEASLSQQPESDSDDVPSKESVLSLNDEMSDILEQAESLRPVKVKPDIDELQNNEPKNPEQVEHGVSSEDSGHQDYEEQPQQNYADDYDMLSQMHSELPSATANDEQESSTYLNAQPSLAAIDGQQPPSHQPTGAARDNTMSLLNLMNTLSKASEEENKQEVSYGENQWQNPLVTQSHLGDDGVSTEDEHLSQSSTAQDSYQDDILQSPSESRELPPTTAAEGDAGPDAMPESDAADKLAKLSETDVHNRIQEPPKTLTSDADGAFVDQELSAVQQPDEESEDLFAAEHFVIEPYEPESTVTDKTAPDLGWPDVSSSEPGYANAQNTEELKGAQHTVLDDAEEEDYHELFAGPIPRVSVDFEIPFKVNGKKVINAAQLDTWSQLIEQSGIVGLNKQLALHSNYVLQGDKVKLIVSEHQKHLFTDTALAAIEEALSETLQHDVKVSAHIGEVIDTPAAVQHAIKTMRQENAVKTIQEDRGVKALCEAFSGTILNETIEPR